MTHTTEPWGLRDNTGDFHPHAAIYADGTVTVAYWYDPSAEEVANFKRAVACVNACAGIPDPSQLRADRDALLGALERAIPYLEDAAAYGDVPNEADHVLDRANTLISRIRGEGE